MISGQGAQPRNVQLGANTVSFRAPAAGAYTIRVRYSPYWRAPLGVCLAATADGMISAHVPAAGKVMLTMPDPLDALSSVRSTAAPACVGANTSTPHGSG